MASQIRREISDMFVKDKVRDVPWFYQDCMAWARPACGVSWGCHHAASLAGASDRMKVMPSGQADYTGATITVPRNFSGMVQVGSDVGLRCHWLAALALINKRCYMQVVQAAICPERDYGLDDQLSAVASITDAYVSNDLQAST